MPWANGRGTSYEIASDRNAAGKWTWRVAIAPVVVDGPFSSLPGVDRKLVVIEGKGMVLEIDGKNRECLPRDVVQFSGDAVTSARLMDGPIVDLGLMTVRGSVTGSMAVVNLAGDMIGSRIIVALSEKVEIEAEGTAYLLERLDAVFQEDEGAICLIGGVIASLAVL
jgi:environmental stress-induced protein Ves